MNRLINERDSARESGDRLAKEIINLIDSNLINVKKGLKILLNYSVEQKWWPGYDYICNYLKLFINTNCSFKGQLFEKENTQFIEKNLKDLIEKL